MIKKKSKIDWEKFRETTWETLISLRIIKRVLLFIGVLTLIVPISRALLCVDSFSLHSGGRIFSVFYWVLIVFFLCGIILLFCKKYRLGYWEYLFGTGIAFLYINLRFPNCFGDSIIPEWAFAKAYGCITFIDIPVGIIALTLFISIIQFITRYFEKFRQNDPVNIFLEDNPLHSQDDSESKEDPAYDHLISKIAPALFQDVYKTSFSIGIIGPWGTGKYSFLGAVKKEVKKHQKKSIKRWKQKQDKKYQDTLFIEFSPFLNHNEEQVIHEFFT